MTTPDNASEIGPTDPRPDKLPGAAPVEPSEVEPEPPRAPEPESKQAGEGTAPLFPIAGIGASAGGLEACRRLLTALPTDTGLGFVIVSHLDPDHHSMLASLLSNATKMPVIEVGASVRVAPNHCYVIPPNRNLGIHDGVLHTLDRQLEQGRHLSVDYFLRTLADDIGERSIGIVLSGTASDGTEGLKAVKAAGGITFAQDQASAEHFGMPGSAIEAGCVDFTLSPEEIALELARLARQPYIHRRHPHEADALARDDDLLGKLFLLLRNRTGNDFTHYKRTTVLRRVHRRMAVHKLSRLVDYLHLMQRQPTETDRLFDDLLINVTGFFREPEAFEALHAVAFPRLFGERDARRPVRIWVPGCSTGEEVYSLAIAMLEFLGDGAASAPVQIFATDIDAKAIEQARTGIYTDAVVAELPTGRLRRFFTQATGGWRIIKAIRDLCVFATQNLVKDPPFSKLDLICCRNLMIYLGPVLQERALQVFHYALEPHGFLLLGNSESIGGRADLFYLVDKTHKLYQTKTSLGRVNYAFVPRMFEPASTSRGAQRPAVGVPGVDIAAAAKRLIMQQYAPPGVVIARDLQILHFCCETGPFLNPTPGMASLHLLKLARPELAVDLRTTVHRAIQSNAAVCERCVRYASAGGEGRVNIHVQPMRESIDGEPLLLVLFEAVMPVLGDDPSEHDSQRVAILEQELASTRDYMQSIIQELEGANEELKSANEEIQSANEELQSTNEELETAKEELQSTNEELATVNDELESRNLDLGAVNSDLTNLLASVNLPILILGRDLNIRQFTPQARPLLNLISADVGRPIRHLKPNVDIPGLEERAMAVIEDMMPQELEAQDGTGHWYSVRMRPYKTLDNRVDGVVMAFIDIDSLKTADALREHLSREQRLSAVVRDADDAMTVQRLDGAIQAWNPAAERIYGYTEQQALAMNIAALIPLERRDQHQAMMTRLRGGERIIPFETERLGADGRRLRLWLNMITLLNADGSPYAFASIERPVSNG
jgi:two-component system CheB/CheR fusion protein